MSTTPTASPSTSEPLVTANPLRGPIRTDTSGAPRSPGTAVRDFHRRLPGYQPTPLHDVGDLADQLGVRRVLVKAESRRLGLPSFKVLGASWATYQALVDRLGGEPEWGSIDELAAAVADLRPLRLTAATDGNHGRAVAFMARKLGLGCDILVPKGTAVSRIDAIHDEGATVTVIDGTYDDAVRRAAAEASTSCLVIADTSDSLTDPAPARVIDGYRTIFDEIDEELALRGLGQPDVVVIPVGVGALMAAAVTHYRTRDTGQPGDVEIEIIGVEPRTANCVQESVIAGHLTTVDGPHESIMAGLNCGTPSEVAWPAVSSGVDTFVSIPDGFACDAMRTLADADIVAGETGAAALAGFSALIGASTAAANQDRSEQTVLILVSEGATDPAGYREIVGSRHFPETPIG